MKFFYVSLLAFILVTGVIAQEREESTPPSKENFPHEIGFAAGFSTAYGLSYRYWPKKVGVQFTAFPMISDSESYISLGLTGLVELDSRDWYRFFGFVGSHLNIQEYNDEYYYNDYDPNTGYYNSTTETVRVEKTKYIFGIGPGIEFTPGGRVGLNIMSGFQFQYVDSDDWGTYPTIETGVYFRF